MQAFSLVPRLSPRACSLNCTESGGGAEFGEFDHVKDVIGRENLIAHGLNQLHKVIFPCICMLTALDTCAGGKVTATQCHCH